MIVRNDFVVPISYNILQAVGITMENIIMERTKRYYSLEYLLVLVKIELISGCMLKSCI